MTLLFTSGNIQGKKIERAMETKIILQEYPHHKRWMRGSMVRGKPLTFKEELTLIVTQWFLHRYEMSEPNVCVEELICISTKTTEERVMFFLRSIWMYDIRIIHLRPHRKMDPSYIKLKISFKRTHKKYYEHMKIITRIST